MPTDTHPYGVMFSEEGSMQCCTYLTESKETFLRWIESLPDEFVIRSLVIDGVSATDKFSTIGNLKKDFVVKEKQENCQLTMAI